MRTVLTFCFFVLLMMPVFLPRLEAQTAKSTAEISERLDRLIKQIELLEKKQQEILTHQDETIAEVKNLKIWVRR